MITVETYVGIGSNLAEPVSQVLAAKRALQGLPNTRLVQFSSLYQSSPMGSQDQPDYINAVAALATSFSPHQLLEQLQSIELQQGRIREQHWGSRTLDLDILLYSNQTIKTADLVIPHYGISQRAFVLFPLFEIAPELDIPGHGLLRQLISTYKVTDIKKLPTSSIKN